MYTHVAKHTEGLNGLCNQTHPLSSDVYLYTQSGPPTGQQTGQRWRNWGTINSKWVFPRRHSRLKTDKSHRELLHLAAAFWDFPYVLWFVFTSKCKHLWMCVYLSEVEAFPNVDVNSCFQRLNVPLGECYLFLWLVLSPLAQCRLVSFYQLVQSGAPNVHLMNWQSSVCVRLCAGVCVCVCVCVAERERAQERGRPVKC